MSRIRLLVREPVALCERCVFGMVMVRRADARGGMLSRTATFCQTVGTFVPSDVETCSRYAPMGQKPFSPWAEVPPLALPIDARQTPGQAL